MVIEMTSIAVILLTLFVALFLTSISLYLTFLFKSKELEGRRNRYVIKFIKPYFERYANERSQNEQVKIIGELI
jgi:flagellar basal body-associated protein FliL